MTLPPLTILAMPDVPKPVSDYLASIGRKGGSSKSDAKAAASRANGAKGGRPKGKRKGRGKKK